MKVGNPCIVLPAMDGGVLGRALGGFGGIVEFNLDEGNQGSFCVVSVCGDVDIYTAPLLDACLQRNVSAGNSDIALDLVGCSYFDSEGIKVLIRALHALGKRGKISICGARGAVRRVFEISGLTTIFALCGSVEDLMTSADSSSASS